MQGDVTDETQRTDLALERTQLALERTLLGWWRTALACYGLGVALAKGLPRMRPANMALDAGIGAAFVTVGLVMIVLATFDARRAYHVDLAGGLRPSVILVIGLLLALGLASLTVVVLP